MCAVHIVHYFIWHMTDTQGKMLIDSYEQGLEDHY